MTTVGEFEVERVAFASTSELRDSVLRPEVARPVDWPGLDGPGSATFAVFARSAALVAGDPDLRREPIVTVSVVPAACYWRPAARGPWQLRAMATATESQGRGVGALAVAAVVDHVGAEGGDLLWCNARLGARTFYERAGFAVEGGQFDVPGIGPHLPMALPLTGGQADPMPPDGTGQVEEDDPLEVQLAGGAANAGAVTRRGSEVRRPSNVNTPTIHRFLGALAATGFAGASVPLGVDDRGRERLRFVEGDVPLVRYPAWARSDAALASVARLLRRFHDSAAKVPAGPDDRWSDEMADPMGGDVVCHNDVCLENVVFRDGEAVALLDFDFAAPGRRTYDLACLARMCVPVDDESRTRFGWTDADLPTRLRLVSDAYGLGPEERAEMVEALSDTIERGGAFLVRRMEAGDANFAEMWEQGGGMARFDRRRAWWAATRADFDRAMR